MKYSISILAFCAFLSLSINSFAQFENIDLNKYKLTDYKYKSLSTSLNAGNSNLYSNSNRTNSFLNLKDNSNHNNLNAGGDFGYYSKTYNRNYYGIQNVGLNFNNIFNTNSANNSYFDLMNSDNISNKSNFSNFGFNYNLNFNSNNLFYLANDFFIGVNLQTSQNLYHSYLKSDYNFNSTFHNNSAIENEFNSKNFVSIQIGKGRYEDVSDARMAIYILDDLLKHGRLSRTLSQDEVFAFADFITKTLNKRVIDSRIKRIKVFVEIDSFLVSNGLSTKTDGLYFGLINDNLNYGRNQSWESGRAWHVGLSPLFNYENHFTQRVDTSYVSKSWNKYSEYGLGLDAVYGSSWISGLKWQKSFWLSASFNIFKFDTTGNQYSFINYKTITGTANYSISYIPNTRTSITGSSGITFTKYLNKGISDKIQITPNISGSCNYYFSEKLRFQVNANVNYVFNKGYSYLNYPNSKSKTLDFGFSAALQYYFF